MADGDGAISTKKDRVKGGYAAPDVVFRVRRSLRRGDKEDRSGPVL
jgi:hypothetical protein